MSYFLNAIRAELNAVKVAGGWKASFYRILRETNLRTGTLIGTDKYGNKYFENNTYFMGRNRFVVFSVESEDIESYLERLQEHFTA